MLAPGIHDAYTGNVRRMRDNGATRIGAGEAPAAAWEGRSLMYEVTGEQLLAEPATREEVFGPFVLLVRLTGAAQLREIASSFRGQLSASLHAEVSAHPAGEPASSAPSASSRPGAGSS